LLGVSSQTIVVFTFNMLLVNGKSFFKSQKDLKLNYLLMSFSSIRNMAGYMLKSPKSIVWSDWWWLFGISSIVIFTINILVLNGFFLQKVKPQIHLLMNFNSIRIMASYILKLSKINMWSDWWWFLGVSSKTTVIFTINMLLMNGKSICRIQNELQFIYLWASKALQL